MSSRRDRSALRPRGGGPATRPAAIATAAAAAGLPASAIIGTRNALEPGSGQRTVPVRSTLLGSVAAVTAVVVSVVFGTSLGGLISHPARYGWNWDVVIQAEGGYGSFTPGVLNRLIDGQRAVAGWSEFAFTQLAVDNRIIPVLGIRRHSGSVQPPTTSGRPIAGNDQIELGSVTLHELGKKIGDSVRVGTRPFARTLTITGTVTLPSFGVGAADHVSLGRGAMIGEATLLAAEGASSGRPTSGAAAAPPAAAPCERNSAACHPWRQLHASGIAPPATPGGSSMISAGFGDPGTANSP